MTPGDHNAQTLERELTWFQQILDIRIHLYFEQACEHASIEEVPAPDLVEDGSLYARTIKNFAMSDGERLVLLLALIPHVRPQVLDTFFIDNQNFKRPLPSLADGRAIHTAGFCPLAKLFPFFWQPPALKKGSR